MQERLQLLEDKYEELTQRQRQEELEAQQEELRKAREVAARPSGRGSSARPVSYQPAPRKTTPVQDPFGYFADLGMPPAAPKTGSRSTSSRSTSSRSTSRSTQSTVEKTLKSTGNALGKELGRQLARGILGTLSRR